MRHASQYNGTRFNNGSPTQRVSNGHYIDILSPRPEQIHIDDIAISLSRQPRYMGHTHPIVPYSVAQHCWLVSLMLEVDGYDDDVVKWGFVHDWAEFVMGDMSSPMKRAMEAMLGNDSFKESWGAIEDGLDIAIRERFKMAPLFASDKDIVKLYDYIALATEKRDLFLGDEVWGNLPPPHEKFKVVPWSPCFAYMRFKDRFVELFGQQLWEETL